MYITGRFVFALKFRVTLVMTTHSYISIKILYQHVNNPHNIRYTYTHILIGSVHTTYSLPYSSAAPVA